MTNNSSEYTPYKLSASTAITNNSNNFPNGFSDLAKYQAKMNKAHPSQFYSYERRSQSPLHQSTNNSQPTRIPT